MEMTRRRSMAENELVVDANFLMEEMKDHIDCIKRLELMEAEITKLKSAVSWQKETIASRDARIAELEEALRPLARAADYYDDIQVPDAAALVVYYSSHTMDDHSSQMIIIGDCRKARTALGEMGAPIAEKIREGLDLCHDEIERRLTEDQDAPGDGLPANACRCARCEAKRNPGERQYDEDMDRWIVFDGEQFQIVELQEKDVPSEEGEDG
jgi:hypothetical protein